MITRITSRPLVAITAVITVGLLAGCASGAAGPDNSDKTGEWTAAEVLEGSDGRVAAPLFAVPRNVDAFEFAFLNPGLSVPTFKDWQTGVQDAADFYGVKITQTDLDLKYENALTAYGTVAVKSPVIVGSGAGAANAALLAGVEADGAKLVLIDQDLEGAPSFGVDNATTGEIGGEFLSESAQARIDDDWAGKNVVYVGISAASCEPCDVRVQKGGEVVAEKLGLESKPGFLLPDPGTADQAQIVFTDYLTAHPNDVFVILGFGDGAAVGALNALKAADRLDDAVVGSLGGDISGRAALRDPSNATTFVGALDFNPYQEGWNWIEAAIATQLGESFAEYDASTVLTPENVDEFYPND